MSTQPDFGGHPPAEPDDDDGRPIGEPRGDLCLHTWHYGTVHLVGACPTCGERDDEGVGW